MDTTFLIHGHKGFSTGRVVQRLMTMGMIRNHALSIAKLVSQWTRCNGVIWTIDRLKSIKLAYINWKAGTTVLIPWLNRDRRGIPKGPFSAYLKYKWSKVVRFLNLHALFKLERVTKAQASKFLQAVSRPQVSVEALASAQYLIKLGFIPDKEADDLSRKLKAEPIVNANPSTYQPYGEVCIQGKAPEPKRIARQSLDDPSNDHLRSLLAQDSLEFLRVSWNRKLLGPLLKDLYAPLRLQHLMRTDMVSDPLVRLLGGSIGITQEPGGKLRCYAAPFLPYQLALKPLKASLEKRISKLETDCTYSHEKARKVQGWLTEVGDGFISAFDLSNATDNFPLSLQTDWMKYSGIDRIQLEIFEKVSRLPWAPMVSAVEQGFPCEPVQWSVGQPLGLNGSFPAFALTHNYLLRGIEKSIFGEVRNEFLVLGDDVVIRDELVAMKYHSVLTALGVPISEAKSIVSQSLSEFAGYIITEKGMNKGTKLSKMTRNSVFELGRTYGPSADKEVRRVVKNDKLVDAMGAIPASVGGLGWGTSSLDKALEPRVNAELFGALTQAKEWENTLPKRLKIDVQKAVWSKLGFSLSDWNPCDVSETHMTILQKIVPSELASECIKIMEANAYIVVGQRIEMYNRKSRIYLIEGNYEQHQYCKNLIRMYSSIAKSIELRYQPVVPDNFIGKVTEHGDSILGEISLRTGRDVVDILSSCYENLTRVAPLSFLSWKEFTRLLGSEDEPEVLEAQSALDEITGIVDTLE